ncbi:MAG: TatD family hydrolase [Clostridia bacterium]|nr:TatD family hydrolase [Clostridia bacterium]
MIIDSHAHYAYPRFDAEIPYLCETDGKWDVRRAGREQLIKEMRESNIVGFIEPSIGFDAIPAQLETVKMHSEYMWAALGVHPTRCFSTAWANRKRVAEMAERENIIAIGETGLDYHYSRKEQHRLRQIMWFIYQIRLADRLRLPLVLHIRMADRDALRILRMNKKRLHGGVVHCFGGDSALAKQYETLGFAVGIGGKLLSDNEQGRALSDTVRNAPLSTLLVETDAPYVIPETRDIPCGANQRKKLCNSSFILPAVIRRIAELRGEPCEAVEKAIYENTVRVFGLKDTVENGND